MQRGQCIICRAKHRNGQAFGKCKRCKKIQASIAKLHTQGPRADQAGKAERVERYAAIVASGRRLFE